MMLHGLCAGAVGHELRSGGSARGKGGCVGGGDARGGCAGGGDARGGCVRRESGRSAVSADDSFVSEACC